eukprot:3708737-Amphidinium_carterae.1
MRWDNQCNNFASIVGYAQAPVDSDRPFRFPVSASEERRIFRVLSMYCFGCGYVENCCTEVDFARLTAFAKESTSMHFFSMPNSPLAGLSLNVALWLFRSIATHICEATPFKVDVLEPIGTARFVLRPGEVPQLCEFVRARVLACACACALAGMTQ